MKKIHFNAAPRTLILRTLAWLHCGLLAGILFAVAFEALGLVGFSNYGDGRAFFRGLLFAIPAALCYHAVKRLPSLWQFLLASLLLCGLAWLLTGHAGGAVLTALMCIFRLRARLAEEEDGPRRSYFDCPTYFTLLAFLAAFLFSGVVGLPGLQKISLLGAVLYFLVCLAFHGVERLDHYLFINKDMRGLPARRIQRVAGFAVIAAVLVSAIFLLPLVLANEGNLRIHLPDSTQGRGQALIQTETPEETKAEEPMEMDLSGLVDGPTWHIPEFVTYIVLGFAGVGLLAGTLAVLRKIFKDFRRSYTDSRDYAQYLTKEEREEVEAAPTALRRPAIWDRSPNAAVRRKYRRAILKAAKEPPQAWMSPGEAEAHAGVDAPVLHALYEKARYGPVPCTQADVKGLK